MLWFKGWLETRFKWAMAFAMATFFLVLFKTGGPPPPGAKAGMALVIAIMSFSVMSYSLLAGAGIVTQPTFQAAKGIHGSTLFTLSLPVSRLRLVAVRAGLGWLETVGVIGVFCLAVWVMVPPVRQDAAPADMLRYLLVLIACTSALYMLSVLLATFLDDLWRIWGGILAFAGLWGLSRSAWMPASLDLVRAMRDGSPLFTHSVPWLTVAFALAMTAVLFAAALKIARAREY